ncbi:MAG: acyltransferase family protein [Paraglaciecola sp.]|uniref:acyltransferase family protein n=1 Tax=Paraglaciecola sp. TaxID=1920173 RepID=UPI00329908C3
MNKTTALNTQRLHCLDWLRVIAIGVLLLYHTGMVYVPDWGYHYKNPLGNDFLKSLMLLTSPWRMGLLWLVSGIALAHMCSRANILTLLVKRTNQILLPLLIGIFFIVPLQLFAQMKQAGDMPLNFIGFVYAFFIQPQQYFVNYSAGIWPRFDVNHLWFLRSLWRFSMILILASPIIKLTNTIKLMDWLSSKLVCLLLLFLIPILMIEWLLEGELVRECYGFVLLLLGFVLGTQLSFWQTLTRHISLLSILCLVAIFALQIGFIVIWKTGLHQTNEWLSLLINFIYILNKILPLFAILALSYRYLNKPNKTITQLNPFVFPLYILHQSVIIMVAYMASNSHLVLLKSPEYQLWLNLVLTPLLCMILLLLISKFNGLRMCFGMRFKNNVDPYRSWRLSLMVLMICAPMIYRLV